MGLYPGLEACSSRGWFDAPPRPAQALGVRTRYGCVGSAHAVVDEALARAVLDLRGAGTCQVRPIGGVQGNRGLDCKRCV